MVEKIKLLEIELANLSVEKVFTKEYFQQVFKLSDSNENIGTCINSQETSDLGTKCSACKKGLNIDSGHSDENYENDEKNNNLETKNDNDLNCCDSSDSSCCSRNKCLKFLPQTKRIERIEKQERQERIKDSAEQLLEKYYVKVNDLLTVSGFDQI